MKQASGGNGKSIYPIRVVAENTCHGARENFKLWNKNQKKVVGKPRPQKGNDAGCGILLKTTKLGKGTAEAFLVWSFKQC